MVLTRDATRPRGGRPLDSDRARCRRIGECDTGPAFPRSWFLVLANGVSGRDIVISLVLMGVLEGELVAGSSFILGGDAGASDGPKIPKSR